MVDATLEVPLSAGRVTPFLQVRDSLCRKHRRRRDSSCAGAEAVRVSCGMAFGAEPPSRLGPAGESEGRAALWLGPDEWLLIADGADAARYRGRARVGARGNRA